MEKSVRREGSPIVCRRLKASSAQPWKECSVGVHDAEELRALRSLRPCSPESLERVVLGADPVAGGGERCSGTHVHQIPGG